MKPPLPKRKVTFFSRFSTAIGIVIVAGGVGILGMWLEANNAWVVTHHLPSVTNSTDMPSTEKTTPTEFDNYQVAADLPRYLFIPKINVRALVKPMNVTQENQIEAPKSAYDAGWYNKSAKPGNAGVMFIDGHVSAGTTPGIFYDLEQLQSSDEIVVERGDGIRLLYQVVTSKTYAIDNVDMKEVLAPISPGTSGLNLITCTGNVMRGTNNYDKRLVVFATLK